MAAVGSATVEKLTESADDERIGYRAAGCGGKGQCRDIGTGCVEGQRIGAVSSAVSSAVSKVEGTVELIRDRGDRLGATGLEMSKLAKDVAWCDRDLTTPMEVLSSALLRSGQCTKRLGLELSAAISPFVI